MPGTGVDEQALAVTSLPDIDSRAVTLDVECIATGKDHNARAVAHVAVVNSYKQVVLDVYVKPPPEEPVVSYLTPLTGLTAERLEREGVSFQEAKALLNRVLHSRSVLIGHNINKDVQWLGLREGEHFESLVDLAGLFRAWNPHYNSWTTFGQDHIVTVLLQWNVAGTAHSARHDAFKSMELWMLYRSLSANPAMLEQAKVHALAVHPRLAVLRFCRKQDEQNIPQRKLAELSVPRTTFALKKMLPAYAQDLRNAFA